MIFHSVVTRFFSSIIEIYLELFRHYLYTAVVFMLYYDYGGWGYIVEGLYRDEEMFCSVYMFSALGDLYK